MVEPVPVRRVVLGRQFAGEMAVKYSINGTGEHGPIVMRRGDWGDLPPEKTGWHAVEWFIRDQIGLEPTHGHSEDGYDRTIDQEVEIKATMPRNTRGARGCFTLRRGQHYEALAQGRDYVVALYRPVGQNEWEMIDHVRLKARGLHAAAGVEKRTWTRGVEMGVR